MIFVSSLRKETRNIESFCFYCRKETPTKDIPNECTYFIVHDENHENDLTITSGNSLRMKNLLIRWMTWNYALERSFVDAMKNFFGNLWAKNYVELVEKLLRSLQDIGTNMSIKVHFFLHNHQDIFLDNCGDVSDEWEERFHQDIKTMEECYQGRLDKRMVADICWSIKRNLNNIEHDRQPRKKKITIALTFMKVLFLLLVYQMIWWKYLSVLTYLIVLFLKT